MARAAAFRGDRRLTQQEIDHIVGQLLSLPVPGFTPDGKPTFAVITEPEIAALL